MASSGGGGGGTCPSGPPWVRHCVHVRAVFAIGLLQIRLEI